MKKTNPYRTFHLVQDDPEGRFTYWCAASESWLYPHEFIVSDPQPTTYELAELPAPLQDRLQAIKDSGLIRSLAEEEFRRPGESHYVGWPQMKDAHFLEKHG